MKCFVIMSYAADFDDVYAVIKQAVEAAFAQTGECFRLDENRPAGRITERLVKELSEASFCVADITGHKPNVMWELGFAMALSKPTIILSQCVAELPFDIKDFQSVEYVRTQLQSTLGQPLIRVARDTIAALNAAPSKAGSEVPAVESKQISEMRGELAELKTMVADLVGVMKAGDATETASADRIKMLEGAWVNRKSGSYAYAKVIKGRLIMPYSFMSNDEMTGVYYGWRKIGEHWFAHYQWPRSTIAGFTFLKTETPDLLSGAWWSSQSVGVPVALPAKAGEPIIWERIKSEPMPQWASQFLDAVAECGLDEALNQNRLSFLDSEE